MPFPVVADSTVGLKGSLTASHTGAIPATTQPGDLLLAFVGVGGGSGTVTMTASAGWVLVAEQIAATPPSQSQVWRKVAEAAEPTFTCTTGGNRRSVVRVLRITGAEGSVEAALAVLPSTVTPDPPSLTPSYGAADTLWIAYYTETSAVATGYPATYPDNRDSDGTTSIADGIATRNLNAASENPGTFTVGSTTTLTAYTLAVRPVDLFVPQVARY